MRSESDVLSDTEIDFYGEPEVQFHFNSGREWESKTTYSYDEEGNKTEKRTVNTTPCPYVDVYDMGDNLEVVVHMPTGNPIIIDWFTVEDEYEDFLSAFINGLESGYSGIKEVTSFTTSEGSEELGDMVRGAIDTNTPSSVKVPMKPTV